MLPAVVKTALVKHLKVVQRQHEDDLVRGFGRVYLPNALERKYPNANKDWGRQWVFPASQISILGDGAPYQLSQSFQTLSLASRAYAMISKTAHEGVATVIP